jgi:hypothetical protein
MGMSIEEQEAQAALRRAFESYLSGQAPTPLELAEAPVLENWRVLIVLGKSNAKELTIPVLFGNVAGHPRLGDVRCLRTSQLIWLDRDRHWARTWNRVYRLAECARDGIDGRSDGAEA